MSDLTHIRGPLAELVDDLAKMTAGSEENSIRRIRQEDLDAQNLYLLLTEMSDEVGIAIDELEQRKNLIDALRGALAVGHSSEDARSAT